MTDFGGFSFSKQPPKNAVRMVRIEVINSLLSVGVSARIAKELKQINSGTQQHGFSCELKDDCLTITFSGPKDTLFQNETFDLNVRFDDKYPFSPPKLQLQTKVYHPNIDKDGKICLTILKMPPEGAYNPTMTVESIVLSVQLLLQTPNAYDPLRADAASDFLLNKEVYKKKVVQQIEDNRKVSSKGVFHK